MSVGMCKLRQGTQPSRVCSPDPKEDVIISYSAWIPLVTTGKILLTVDAHVVFSVNVGTQRRSSAHLGAESGPTCCFYRIAITLTYWWLDLGFPANKSVVVLMGWQSGDGVKGHCHSGHAGLGHCVNPTVSPERLGCEPAGRTSAFCSVVWVTG